MRFSDTPGQEGLKDSLRRLADNDTVPHAILLSGAEGTGKMMLARAFAQYLHCRRPVGGEPCRECPDCRMHAELSHPDLHFVYPIVKREKEKIATSADILPLWQQMLVEHPEMPSEQWLEIINAGNSQPSIYVNEADSIVQADSYPPFTSPRKIFIIWRPERMQTAAANKLLKVIEEPMQGTVFILVSDNELQLLPTIYSRTQRFHVGSIENAELTEWLIHKRGLGEDEARRIASIAGGNLINASRLASHSGETEEFRLQYMEIMRQAYKKGAAALKKIADRLGDSKGGYGREKLRRFLLYMGRMARENYLYNLGVGSLVAMTREEEEFASRFAPFIHSGNVEELVKETDRARIDIERNANAKLVLFDFFILLIILIHKKRG